MIAGRKRSRSWAAVLLVVAMLPAACREKPRFDYDFEREAFLDELGWKCGTLYRLSPLHATSGANSLEVTFYPGPSGDDESYPGLSLSDFDANWSGYRAMVFDAYNPEEKAIILGIRIDDRENPDYADRFNKAITLQPGDNHISIPFSLLNTSGPTRTLDLGNILVAALFMVNPKERHTVFFDRIRLE